MNYCPGSFRVVRRCCTSGNCSECHDVTPLGQSLKIVQGSGYSKEYAEFVAANWSRYSATVEKVPGHE